MAKALLIFAVVLLVLLYIQYYTKYNTNYRIVQASLANIDGKHLYERYPIVISERLVNPEALLSTLFRFTYTSEKRCVLPGTDQVFKTYNKYLMVFNPDQDVEIDIVSPAYSKEFVPWKPTKECVVMMSHGIPFQQSTIQYVTIRLKKQQVMILPSYWMYHCTQPHRAMGLNDPLSSLIHLVHLWRG